MILHGLLFVLALAASNEPKKFTVAVVDRAVKRLDLSAERASYVAAHPTRAALGAVPGFSAEITIEEQGLDLAPDYHAYQTLPYFGAGGRQGPGYNAITGIPWWMH